MKCLIKTPFFDANPVEFEIYGMNDKITFNFDTNNWEGNIFIERLNNGEIKITNHLLVGYNNSNFTELKNYLIELFKTLKQDKSLLSECRNMYLNKQRGENNREIERLKSQIKELKMANKEIEKEWISLFDSLPKPL